MHGYVRLILIKMKRVYEKIFIILIFAFLNLYLIINPENLRVSAAEEALPFHAMKMHFKIGFSFRYSAKKKKKRNEADCQNCARKSFLGAQLSQLYAGPGGYFAYRF